MGGRQYFTFHPKEQHLILQVFLILQKNLK